MRKPPKRNLTQAIVERLGHAVVTGEYGARAFPIEAQLCEEFGASRTVLREAVKMLTAKGLLSARPRHGTSVEPEAHWNLLDPDVLRWILERKFSLQLLAEFTEVRLAIEPMAAAMAAQRVTPQTLAPMRNAIQRMRAAARGEDDPLASDIAFHVAVLRASGNRFYAQLEDLTDTALRISIRLANRVKGVAFADVAAHNKILLAIEAGNPDRARAAMETLIREAMDLIEAAARDSRTSRAGAQKSAASKKRAWSS